MEKPEAAKVLEEEYLNADFARYVGYFEIPQEYAKELAQYIKWLEVQAAIICKN